MNIYVASSWRNDVQPAVVELLRHCGHDVYDFKGSEGFHWSEVHGADWRTQTITPEAFVHGLDHKASKRGYARDMHALKVAQAVVLVLPCNRSAHLELGYGVGAGKLTAVLLEDPCEPELMYKMVDYLCADLSELETVFSR